MAHGPLTRSVIGFNGRFQPGLVQSEAMMLCHSGDVHVIDVAIRFFCGLSKPASTDQETDVTTTPSYKYYAGGTWREAEAARTFEVLEPYSRKPFAQVAAGGRAEARMAVEAAA